MDFDLAMKVLMQDAPLAEVHGMVHRAERHGMHLRALTHGAGHELLVGHEGHKWSPHLQD